MAAAAAALAEQCFESNFGWFCFGPVTLYIDNKWSAIDLAKNMVFHGRRSSKHIDVRYHFIRECLEHGKIIGEHVSSDKQWAEYCLTKGLVMTVKFEKMWNLLGVRELTNRVRD